MLHLLVCYSSAYPPFVQWQVDALLYGSKKARLFAPFCMRHANLCVRVNDQPSLSEGQRQ